MTASPLLEREHELAEIDQALDAAVRGRGAMVMLEGAPGNGLSSLLHVARRRADQRGFTVLAATGSRMERGTAFHGARQLLERASGGETFVAALAQPQRQDDGDQPEAAFAVVHALYRLTAQLAGRGPLVVLVDDANWLDEPSLRLLAYLARRVEPLPVALVIAARRYDAGGAARPLADIAADHGLGVRRLAPLSPEAVAQRVRRTFPGAGDARCRAVHARTGGNPLLLDLLLEAADAADGLGTSVPASIEEVLSRRIEELSPDARTLLRAAAVLDEPAAVLELAGLEPAAADTAAAELGRRSLIEETGAPGLRTPLLREVVLARLEPAECSDLHRRAADVLRGRHASIERVASHLLETRPGEGGDCVGDLRAAADAARAHGAPAAAARFLERAIAEPAPAADAPELLRVLGICAGYAQRFACAEQRLLEAVTLARGEQRTLARYSLGRFLNTVGRSHEAVEHLAAGLAELDRDSSPELEQRLIAALLGAGRLDIDRRRVVEASLDRMRALEAPAWPGWEAHRLANEAIEAAFSGAGHDRARELALRALRGGAMWPGHSGFLLAVHALFASGELSLAASELEHGCEVAALCGANLTLGLLRAYRGRVALAAGDLFAAAEHVEPELPDEHVARPILLAVRTELALEAGDLGAARACVSGVHYAPAGNVLSLPLLAARGRLELGEGRFADAAATFESYGERSARRGAARMLEVPWRSTAALAHHAAGRTDQARRLAAQELALARGAGAPAQLGIALRAHGIVTASTADLEASCTALNGSPAFLETARSRLAYGTALVAERRVREGREQLREAIEIAAARGARVLVQDATRAMRAGGGTPPRVQRTGSAALTPAQRHVAELAASGARNREIACELGLSEKTIEVHLQRVYRKLGIKSRHQIAGSLGR